MFLLFFYPVMVISGDNKKIEIVGAVAIFSALFCG